MTATWDDFRKRNRQALADARRCEGCAGPIYDHEGGDEICPACIDNAKALTYGPNDPQPEPVPKEQARMI